MVQMVTALYMCYTIICLLFICMHGPYVKLLQNTHGVHIYLIIQRLYYTNIEIWLSHILQCEEHYYFAKWYDSFHGPF